MAITKIKAVKGYLAQCLDYTANPHKTERFADPQALNRLLQYSGDGKKTEHQLFVRGFHCDPANAWHTMQATKARWGKDGEGHVAGYHLIQSFAPGEVTPEQCFAIGCEFAQRYLADRYECTVSTHLDKGHLHCHVVFNSVSFVDGKMFRNTFDADDKGIRKTPEELCREQGLSVIETDGKGRSRIQWEADQNGKPTVRSLVKADMDAAMGRASSWADFLRELERQGYTVCPSGPNRKYTTLRPPSGQRSIRLASMPPGYREEDVKAFFLQKIPVEAKRNFPPPQAPCVEKQGRRSRYAGRLPISARHKITGFMALYYRYCYLLRQTKAGRAPRRYRYLLLDELRRFDRYQKQCSYLWANRIQTPEDLAAAAAAAQTKLHDLLRQRKRLYGLAENPAAGRNRAELSGQIEVLGGQIKALRQELRLCGYIQQDAQRLAQELQQLRRIDKAEQERKEHERNESRRRSR